MTGRCGACQGLTLYISNTWGRWWNPSEGSFNCLNLMGENNHLCTFACLELVAPMIGWSRISVESILDMRWHDIWSQSILFVFVFVTSRVTDDKFSWICFNGRYYLGRVEPSLSRWPDHCATCTVPDVNWRDIVFSSLLSTSNDYLNNGSDESVIECWYDPVEKACCGWHMTYSSCLAALRGRTCVVQKIRTQ